MGLCFSDPSPSTPLGTTAWARPWPLDALWLDFCVRPSGPRVKGNDAHELCRALRPLRAVSLNLSNCRVDDAFCSALLRSLRSFACADDRAAAQWAELDLDFRWNGDLTDAGVAHRRCCPKVG